MVNSNKSILVTGATGAIGPAVLSVLSNAGYRIRILSRSKPTRNSIPDDIEVYTGDITNLSSVKRAMKDCDTVVHLAALLHIVNPPPSLASEYERVNVGGTGNIVNAAKELNVKHIVFASTINVYGSSNGQILTESSPACPETTYAKTKLAAEELVISAESSDGKPIGTVLRLGAIYGPGIKGNYQQLLKMLNSKRFIQIGPGTNRRTLIYDKDVGLAVLLCINHSVTQGRVFNISDGENHTVKDIILAMCNGLERTSPRLLLPVRPMRLIAGLIEDTAESCGLRSPIVRATIDKYTEDIAVSNQLSQSELGFSPQFNLQNGWNETIQEMRRNGEI